MKTEQDQKPKNQSGRHPNKGLRTPHPVTGRVSKKVRKD